MIERLEEQKAKVTRCAVYTRVSTDQQAEVEFNSCEAQEDRIRSFVASQDGFNVVNVYSDPGYSGANMERPALRSLINDVAAGRLDMVVTYKIDRLTRSPRDFYQLIEHLESNKVGFISVTERFDTSTPSGLSLIHIFWRPSTNFRSMTAKFPQQYMTGFWRETDINVGNAVGPLIGAILRGNGNFWKSTTSSTMSKRAPINQIIW